MSQSHFPVVVAHQDNLKFTVQIGRHQLTTDQPVSSGGDDAGPAPLDFLAASLGACVSFYVQQFCVSREISHEGLRVEVRYHKVPSPSRVGGFDVRVVLPADFPRQQLPLIDRVARNCPAHNTLAHGADVLIQTEIGMAAEGAIGARVG
jgi:putative redox protein